ncbi:MAG: hypothetical protein ACRDOK_11155 [Streptosporangiaceae bacterium]
MAETRRKFDEDFKVGAPRYEAVKDGGVSPSRAAWTAATRRSSVASRSSMLQTT